MFGPWPKLLDASDLLEAAAEIDPGDVTAVARLRQAWSAELVRAALELTVARRKASEKFEHPQRIIADVVGVEQATSLDVARHKAQRFAEIGASCVLDLCCGIGGDAMALAEVGRVLMFDSDPDTVWMARHNSGSAAAVADVTTLTLRGQPYHIDPSRRSGGRRKWRYEEYEPGPAFIERLARGDAPAPGAVKLSPGVEFDKLPPGEVEVINRRGTLVQAVLWTGRLARHERTATRVHAAAPQASSLKSQACSLSLHGTPDLQIPIEPPQRYLYAVDPAIERAGLIGELCRRTGLPAIHPALGLLTAESLVENPWLTAFELIESMPWRARDPGKVKQWLESHGAGIVEIKTRGQAADADKAQRDLRGEGNIPFTVFILRFGVKLQALITRRVGQPRGARG